MESVQDWRAAKFKSIEIDLKIVKSIEERSAGEVNMYPGTYLGTYRERVRTLFITDFVIRSDTTRYGD